ncbi:MAG: galactose-1-phosphate uridylyltransferase, partial [Oscillibacter sp.]|nr:galactose-1-phosphate uridylyltransferase [Oscillibacter sp.]
MYEAVSQLISYALQTGLIEESERVWAFNAILDALNLDAATPPENPEPIPALPSDSAGRPKADALAGVLDKLLDDAYERGVLKGNSADYRDLLDTEIMGRLTPRPAQVIAQFKGLYRQSPKAATDWYYRFSQDTNYIRRDRIAKDIQWKSPTEYGDLDITINLSKPEKDPKAIAAARNLPASNYPRCLLCAENEGYAGRLNHPARQNHRLIPILING